MQRTLKEPLLNSSRPPAPPQTRIFTAAAVLWFTRLRRVDSTCTNQQASHVMRSRRGEYDDEPYEEVGSDHHNSGYSRDANSSTSQKQATASPHASFQDDQQPLHEATIRYAAMH